jgi:hypothetical protein
MCQQKTQIVFHTESPHLKLIGEMLDKTQATLLSLVELVSANCAQDADYAALLPSVHDLCTKYHLKPADAFYLTRRVLARPGISGLPGTRASFCITTTRMARAQTGTASRSTVASTA